MAKSYFAVADIHGHLPLFEKILAAADASLGSDYVLVTLGDYVDNGPEIPETLNRLIQLKKERAERFLPLMGNHDLACARTLGWQGAAPNEAWWSQWVKNFGGNGTGRAYRAHSAKELAQRMPKDQQAFLQGLPWFHETDEYVFVHAGLLDKPLRPQLDELAQKKLPKEPSYTNPQLRDPKLATVSSRDWGKVVVSAHTERPAPEGHENAPHYADAWRISLSAQADKSDQVLYAVVLPERRVLAAYPDGPVKKAGVLK